MIIETLSKKPVEIVSAAILIIVGLGIALLIDSPAVAAAGGAVSTIGGFLLSWSAATLDTEKAAAEKLKPHLETTSRRLGTVSSQLSQIVEQVATGEIDSSTGYHLVNASNATLYGLVNDIQRLAGSQFDTADLFHTIDRIEELTNRFSGKAKNSELVDQEVSSDLVESLKHEVESLRSQFFAAGRVFSPAQAPRKRVLVDCPNSDCGARSIVAIGDYQGASAFAVCQSCGERFHAHYSNGRVFSSPEGTCDLEDLSGNEYRYAKILRDQVIKLLPERIRGAVVRAIVRYLEDTPTNLAESWEEIDNAALKDVTERGFEVDSASVKKARSLMYRARLFRMLPDKGGVGLADGIQRGDVVDQVDASLISRIVQVDGPAFDVEAVARILYGDAAYGPGKVTQLVATGGERDVA